MRWTTPRPASGRRPDADADKTAPRVTIVHHPDVRRALLIQKAYAEGFRALYLFTAAHQDAASPRSSRGPTPRWPSGSTTCCCRSSRVSVGTGIPVPHRIAADVRRVGVSAGLSDRAVHPRRQDRLAVRGHHRDPGAGLLLPQDRPRPGRRPATWSARSRLPRQRRGPARTGGGRALLATALADVQAMVAGDERLSPPASQQNRPRAVPRRLVVGAVPAGGRATC